MRIFSYIAVAEQAGFVRFRRRNNTLTEPCGLSFRELHRLSDDDLMDHLRLSHDEALTVLFDRYHRLVLSIALKILRDSGEAEDLVQDVFLNLHQTAVRFDPARGNTKAWVIQMAYRRSYNRRQYLATRAFYSAEEVQQLVEKAMLPFGLQTPESRHLAAQMLDQVHGPQRRALQLVCLQGLTMEEVAAKMGESVGNVRHHYYRGLAHLRAVVRERSRKAVVSTAQQEALNAKP
jgi:RNA polymerase sigma-70 factor (ECF subfamily)